MLLALVASLVLSAGPGDSPGSEPMQAIILGGGKTQADAERAQRRWEAAQAKVGVRAQASFPQVVRSADVEGLKPGFVVSILGYCPAPEAQRLLERIRSEIAGAYVRDVTARSAACPVTSDPRMGAALAAVEKGDLPAVKRALDEGLDVNAVSTGAVRTLLDMAFLASKPDVALLLLQRGAEPTSEALFQAAAQGSVEIVRLLLEKKVDPNSVRYGDPVLLTAIRSGKPEVVTALLDAGADAKRTYKAGVSGPSDGTPLYFASACVGGPELLEVLAKHGLDLRATTPQGSTMLIHAVNDCFSRTGSPDERTPRWAPARLARINALIAAGVNVNARTDSGTALHEAIRVDDLDAAKALLKAGANLTLTDKEGNTPLHRAALSGDPEILKAVLAGHPSVNAVNERHESALYLATWSQNDDPWGMVEPLLDAGADAKLVSDKGYSAADWACLTQGDIKLARHLIKLGAPFKDGRPKPEMCSVHEGD